MSPVRHIFETANSKSLDSKNRYLLQDAGIIHNTVDAIMTTNKEQKKADKEARVEYLMKIAEKNATELGYSGVEKKKLLMDLRNKLDNMK